MHFKFCMPQHYNSNKYIKYNTYIHLSEHHQSNAR